jgi:hypothetical protein
MPGFDAPLDLAQTAPARSAGTGRLLVYPKADGRIYSTDSTGAEQLEGQELPMLAPVRASTTYLNITQSGLQTVDTVALAAGDRVLCRGQTGGLTNGIWVAASGAWTRATDADTAAKLTRGTQVAVLEGTADRGKVFTQLNVITTLGTDQNNWRVTAIADTAGSLQYPPSGMVEGNLFWDRNAKSMAGWSGIGWERLNGMRVCTSTTRPIFTGDDACIYETDTGNAFIYQGGAWQPLGNSAFAGAGAGGGLVAKMVAAFNITVSSPGIVFTTIDGVTPASGDRVLLTAQTAPAENGIWIWNGTSSAMTRATDSDTATELAGAEVAIQRGDVYGGSRWRNTFKSTDTLGTTAMPWVIQNPGGDTPDWRSLSLSGSVVLPNSVLQLAFNVDNGGSGASASGGRITVVKAGIYHVTTSISFSHSTGTAQFQICTIKQWRGGSMVSERASVAHTNGAGTWDVAAVDGIFTAQAGDIFDVALQSQVNVTTYADSARCHFSLHQISSMGANGDLTYGFRGTATQSITNSATTAVLIQDAPDHTCGGISRTGSIITVDTAGIYQLQGQVHYVTGANCRTILWIEGWTGTDPGVGNATQLATTDINLIAGQVAYQCNGQVYLQAGHKLRLLVWQGSGSTVTLNSSAQLSAKLNIRKISQGGMPQDTGWTAMTFNAGIGNYGGGFQTGAYKRVGNQVFLRGLLNTSAGLAAGFVITTLPVGFRPGQAELLPLFQSAGALNTNRLDVQTTGALALNPGAATGSGQWVALGGISFFTD